MEVQAKKEHEEELKLQNTLEILVREGAVADQNARRFFKNEEGYQKLQQAKQLDAQNKQFLSLGPSSVNKISEKTVKSQEGLVLPLDP